MSGEREKNRYNFANNLEYNYMNRKNICYNFLSYQNIEQGGKLHWLAIDSTENS